MSRARLPTPTEVPSRARPRRGRLGGSLVVQCSICLLLCSITPAHANPDAGDAGAGARARFEAALDLVGHDDAEAAARLERFAEDDPHGEYADDALIEAAQLLEEKLGRPDHARDLYARLVTLSPTSRLALRARARLEFLDGALKGPAGAAAVLGDYQKILSGFATRPPAESQRQMDALVTAHPDFALADKALLWLAGLAARDGHRAEAERRYEEVERRFPGTGAWADARQGRAEMALAAGRLDEAAALYRSLGEMGQGKASQLLHAGSAAAGLRAVASAERRRLLYVIALVYLTLWLGLNLVSARPLRRLEKLPVELLYYLPVAGLFVAVGARESRAVALAISTIAIGGAVLLMASVSATARRLERGPMHPVQRAGRIAGLVIAVLALGYAAVHKAHLVDMVIETVINGPESLKVSWSGRAASA